MEKHHYPGLDLVRVLAAITVVFHHTFIFQKPNSTLLAWGFTGELAVEWFFVLSGFLVGGSILNKVAKGQFSQPVDLWNFLRQRWLRTLPLYYAFLIYTLFIAPDFSSLIPTALQCVFFVQNFAWPVPDFYFQSWTLTILEFFYLLFSLALLLSSALIKNRLLSLLIPIGLFLLVPFFLRLNLTTTQDFVQFNDDLRKWVIFRLDAPVTGVILALIQREWPALWSACLRFYWGPLALFAGLLLYCWLGMPLLFTSHLVQILFLPAVSLIFAINLPLLCSLKEIRAPIGKAIGFLSTLSYSTYTSHVLALLIAVCLLRKLGVDQSSTGLTYLVFTVAVLTVATLSYYLIERPFLKFRKPPQNAGRVPVPMYRLSHSRAKSDSLV